MTCYFRHLNEVFQKAGIEVNIANKKDLDKIIHQLVNVNYKNCTQTWREVKKRIAEDEQAFVTQLRKAWIQYQKRGQNQT